MGHMKPSIALLFLILPTLAFGIFMQPATIPVERVITNLEAQIKAEPKNHTAVYHLARACYLAFALDTAEIAAYKDAKGNFKINSNSMGRKVPAKRSIAESQVLAERAAKNFKQALEMDPENALYHLGLASLQLQYVERTEKLKWADHPGSVSKFTLETARESFYQAIVHSKEEYKKLEHLGPSMNVTEEAIRAFLKLCDEAKIPKRDAKRKEAVALQKEGMKKPRAVTPIVIGNHPGEPLQQLLSPDTHVEFDLDGDDLVETWPWVQPETGILVWDPKNSGRIESGRQLFGNATWWMMFNHGYQPLDCLDDNRDGRLSEDELIGLAIWRDRDSNGRSDAGEVTPAAAAGIEWISTQFETGSDGVLQNPSGISIHGQQLPTYDWVATENES